MREEITGKRPSRLSVVYRRHASKGGRLADWTRQVDGDWRLYCPHCAALVVLQEEKDENSLQKSWSVTRRAATRHEDCPSAQLVVTHSDGTYTVTEARVSRQGRHESLGPERLTEDQFVTRIEVAFVRHCQEAGHEDRIPARLRLPT